MKNNGKVFYLCFYAEPEVEDKIVVYPSVLSKIDYIVDTVKAAGKEVVVVSVAPSCSGRFSGFEKVIDEKETHIYLPSTRSKNKIIDILYFLKNAMTILMFLLKNVKKNDHVLVYHSLYHRLWIKIYSAIACRKLILQIEDVFSSLTKKARIHKNSEWKLFNKMQRCLCVNDILYNDLAHVPGRVVSYGSYNLPPQYPVQTDGKVRAVYAGVIEQERNAAFLAVQAARYLPEDYEVHILGFGTDENIQALNTAIHEMNRLMGRDVVFFHGKKVGEAYWAFLQGCDVALSTHTYNAETIESANYTFPSKVLTYMANNLPVVAQRLSVLECSAVSDNMAFYDDTRPEAVADAIVAAHNAKGMSCRQTIEALDREFKSAMKALLEAEQA